MLHRFLRVRGSSERLTANPVREWFKQTFSDPQVLLLTIILIVVVAAIMFVANMVAPVIAALVIAFLLDGLVGRLKRIGIGHLIAINVVFVGFVLASLLFVLGLMPVLIRQIGEFIRQAPIMMGEFQDLLMQLPEQYPEFITQEQVRGFMSDLGRAVVDAARVLPSFAGTSVVTLLTAVVYIILVLLLVFFMIKDKQRITEWVSSFLPRDRDLTTDVWRQVNRQIGNYVRGKFWEILIVGGVTYIVFASLGVNFSALLAVITGLSVLIPYVGAAAVTLPVAVVGFVAMGHQHGVALPPDCLRCHPGLGWQPPGADPVQRGRRSAPHCHHCRDPCLWWVVGVLGRVLCHPTGNRRAGSPACLAARIGLAQANLAKNNRRSLSSWCQNQLRWAGGSAKLCFAKTKLFCRAFVLGDGPTPAQRRRVTGA